MAMACIFLAAKIEEDCRRLRDIINVFHLLKQKRTKRYVVCARVLEYCVCVCVCLFKLLFSIWVLGNMRGYSPACLPAGAGELGSLKDIVV